MRQGGFLVVEFVSIQEWFVTIIGVVCQFFLMLEKLFISESLSGLMNGNLLS